MKPIQFLLIALLAAGVTVYFARLRSRLIDRALILVMTLAGSVLILAPEWSTRLAVLLGVGRGVDLVIYLTLLALTFSCLLLYSQIRTLQGRLTELIRAIALRDAHEPVQSVTVPLDRRTSNAA